MRQSSRTRRRRARLGVDDVTAVLLVSANAKELAEFYRATLGLPLEEEEHEGIPPHYGCSLGDVQFAIHPAGVWPGVAARNARSPVISFGTSDLDRVIVRLKARGVRVTGPQDHEFGRIASFRDPDGHHVSLIEYASEHW